MLSRIKLICYATFILTYAGTCLALDTIRWNHGHYQTDKRRDFKAELLTQVMERTSTIYGPYVILESDQYRVTKRAIQQVKEGKSINIFMAVTSPEWENSTHPIRIPIRRGILNYRLLAINKNKKEDFAETYLVSDLKKHVAGLRTGWATIGLMQEYDFSFKETVTLDGLYEMLAINRIDYIPRGLNEINDEITMHKKLNKNVMVEPTVAIYTQSPYYIFVSPHEKRLAKRIEDGLEMMIEDGSHKALFEQYYADKIAKADIPSRHIIRIENKTLSPKTPLDRKELWFEYDKPTEQPH